MSERKPLEKQAINDAYRIWRLKLESNVVTLETAKKLQAAGFPHTSAYMWRELKDGGGELQRRRGRQIGEFEFAAPTAQEIADQLPEDFSTHPNEIDEAIRSLTLTKSLRGWDAAYGDIENPYEGLAAEDGPTMAEALAQLLLKLVEDGSLKF